MKLLSFKTIEFLYKNLVKPVFFSQDAEKVHERILKLGSFLGSCEVGQNLTRSLLYFNHPALAQTILGIKFDNPIGLAAGFDKNAHLTQILSEIGFGFEEIGSITNKKSQGNKKPRLWRLPSSNALVVNYGLPNEGVDKILVRLSSLSFKFPIGISLAKTNSPQTADKKEGVKDYVAGFKKIIKSKIGDYITINVSCPNAYGGLPFTDKKSFDELFSNLDEFEAQKPIFVKLPPDYSQKELDDILQVCLKHKIDGIILSNLTKDRKNPRITKAELARVGPGGISGKPTEEKSNNLINFAYKNYGGKLVIIGCGGVFSAQDAYRKIRLGAHLVQMITGMVFGGPQTISQINMGLVELLQKDGYRNISEAIGKDA